MSVLKHSLISAILLVTWASAQWVPGASTRIQLGTWSNSPSPTFSGYNPAGAQISVLGSSIANGFDDLILVTDGNVAGTINVVSVNNDKTTVLATELIAPQGTSYTPVLGEDAITYDDLGAMVVLRPLNGQLQSALVVLASTRNLYVCEITLTREAFNIKTLKTTDLTDNSTQATGNYIIAGRSKRLALLSTTVSGGKNQYHLALSNPYYQNGNNAATGRVDFLTLDGNNWSVLQSNPIGITGGVPSTMFALSENALFGVDIASAGDVDGDGVTDLAVLAPSSQDYPNSALLIFLMKDESTPKAVSPIELAGGAYPWKQKTIDGAAPLTEEQDCNGISSSDFDGDGINEYVVACANYSSKVNFAFRLKLNKKGVITQSALLFTDHLKDSFRGLNSPSLLLWENDLQAPRLLTPFMHGTQAGSVNFLSTPIYNVDASKNYAVVAGAASDSIVNIDSLFYKSGQSGYTFKTLSGPVDCKLSTSGKGMLCSSSSPISVGSWSAIEVTAGGACGTYEPCKLKDTLYVAALEEGYDFALRMPHQVLPVNSKEVTIGSLRSLAFIRDYSQKSSSSVTFNGIKNVGTHATVPSVGPMNTFSFSTLLNQKNIDTLQFELKTTNGLTATFMPVVTQIHVVSPEKLVTTPFPATPGLDTLYGAVSGMYYALPLTNIKGDALTYDVEQDFENDVEIVGNYLRVNSLKKPTLILRYVEEKTIKSRQLVLVFNTKPTSILLDVQNHFNMHAVAAGLQINGLAGDYQVRVFGLNGQLLQEQQGSAYGSMLLPLNYSGVQVVRVQNANQVHILKVMR